MNEPKQKLIDQQMLALPGFAAWQLNMGESNWYNARRGAIGGLEGTAPAQDTSTRYPSGDAPSRRPPAPFRPSAQDHRKDPLLARAVGLRAGLVGFVAVRPSFRLARLILASCMHFRSQSP